MPWLVGGTFALVVGFVVVGDLTKPLVGGLGIAMLLLTEGIAGVIQIAIVLVLILWLLGAVRGWVG